MARTRRKKMKSFAETVKENGTVSTSRRQTEEYHTQSDLPTELLELILSQLTLRDNIRASAVCKRWLAVAISVRMANKPPWLMFSQKSDDAYQFYDPSQQKTYWLEFPELRGSTICYAKDGWLLLYKSRPMQVFFFCPYTQELIELPRLALEFQRVAFSAAPTSPNCVIFTVRQVSATVVQVSTCRPGATEWATVDYENRPPFVSTRWNQLAFCKGLFYCLSLNGWLGIYNPEKSTWVVHTVPPPECPENIVVPNWWKGKFMAEHNGDIFVVYTCAAINPIIYKFDPINKVWVEMETLGGMTIFASFLSSHARTDLHGKMRNTVYFPKVRFYGKRCITYSLEDGRYYPRKQSYDWVRKPFESLWIEPPEDLSTIL